MADKAYIIEPGFVKIYVGDGANAVQLNVFSAGDIFGEMSLIDSCPRSASVRTLTQCYCVAVHANELLFYYQSLLNLNSGRLVDFEALLRWHSPSRGMVSPQKCIELAEETSLIVPS